MTWVTWNLTLFCLQTVLVSMQDRCMVCARCTIGLQIILDAPDGTPRSRGSCGANLDARFASNIPLDQKSFWTHPMELLGDVGHVESHFIPFGDSVSVGAK